MEPVMGRRKLLKGSIFFLASLATSRVALARNSVPKAGKGETEEVNPPEDLMREHGVLRRILLIYRSFIGKLDDRGEIRWDGLGESAAIVRTFMEDYHEKLEERYVFPAMRKAGRLVDLVDTLLAQHQAGRRLTDMTTGIAKGQGREQADRKRLQTALGQFIRMYEPHAAREDTILFPELHRVWRGKEFGKMGDLFEKEEDRLFGEGGFEKMVGRVAAIEKDLDLYDLRQFTPGA
jgi:hemerythrin-like domain-containing protein